MSLSNRSKQAVAILETLSLIGLMTSTEIELIYFVVPLAFLLIALSIKLKVIRISPQLIDRLIFGNILALITIGSTLIYLDVFHPLVLIGQLAPILLSSLWWQKFSIRNRAWRIGLSFIQLAIATSLSPEFHYAILLFIFITIACLAITLIFLEVEFKKHKRIDLIDRPNFSLKSFILFFILSTFVLSLLIFPFLPRLTEETSGHAGTANQDSVGYNESLDLHSWSKLSGSNDGPIVMRIFFPNTEKNEVVPIIKEGLFRSAVLSDFDGENWKLGQKTPLLKSKGIANNKSDFILKVFREPIASRNLPAPYSTSTIKVLSRYITSARRLKTGEWSLPITMNEVIRYEVHLKENTVDKTPPEARDLYIPNSWMKSGNNIFKSISNKIFRGLDSNSDKIKALEKYFMANDFSASLSEKSKKFNNHKSLLEEFLTNRKKGHCEFFASASALLLRSAGVPARLVVGFRSTQNKNADFLTIRQGNAHAWVEAWTPKKGWLIVDNTPTAEVPFSLSMYLRDNTEFLAAFWYQYVLSFDRDQQRLFVKSVKQMLVQNLVRFDRTTILTIVLVITAVLLVFSFIRLSRRKKQKAKYLCDFDLVIRRYLFEKFRSKLDVDADSWISQYEELRFGDFRNKAVLRKQKIRDLDLLYKNKSQQDRAL